MASLWAEWQSHFTKTVYSVATTTTFVQPHARTEIPSANEKPISQTSWNSQSQTVNGAVAYVPSIVSIQLHSYCWAVYAERREAAIMQKIFKKTVSELCQYDLNDAVWCLTPLCEHVCAVWFEWCFHQQQQKEEEEGEVIGWKLTTVDRINARKYAFCHKKGNTTHTHARTSLSECDAIHHLRAGKLTASRKKSQIKSLIALKSIFNSSRACYMGS